MRAFSLRSFGMSRMMIAAAMGDKVITDKNGNIGVIPYKRI
jgi:hypothetical protein